MDELKRLKKAWDDSFKNEEIGFSTDNIRGMIRKKSNGTIEKLKRSLYLEIGVIFLVLPFLVVVLFVLPQPYFFYNTLFLIILFVFVLAYYYQNLRKVIKIWQQPKQNLRERLEATLTVFRFFRKTYFYLNIALFPLALYFGFVIGFGLGSDGERIAEIFYNPNVSIWANVMIFVLVFGLIFGLFLLFLKFYMAKLYDIHINKLRNILSELMEHEN